MWTHLDVLIFQGCPTIWDREHTCSVSWFFRAVLQYGTNREHTCSVSWFFRVVLQYGTESIHAVCPDFSGLSYNMGQTESIHAVCPDFSGLSYNMGQRAYMQCVLILRRGYSDAIFLLHEEGSSHNCLPPIYSLVLAPVYLASYIHCLCFAFLQHDTITQTRALFDRASHWYPNYQTTWVRSYLPGSWGEGN